FQKKSSRNFLFSAISLLKMRPSRPPRSKKRRLPNVRAAGAIVKAWAKAALTPICATAARAWWRRQNRRDALLRVREDSAKREANVLSSRAAKTTPVRLGPRELPVGHALSKLALPVIH